MDMFELLSILEQKKSSSIKNIPIDDIIFNEIYINMVMSNNGIAPKVYDYAMKNKKGYIVMDKYDGTLTDLLHRYQYDKTIDFKSIKEILKNYIKKMHDLGIVHRDLSSNNIVYKTDGSIAIIDYEFSIYSDNKDLRSRDYIILNKLDENIEFINSIEQSKEEDLYHKFRFFIYGYDMDYDQPIFLYKNEKVYDWSDMSYYV